MVQFLYLGMEISLIETDSLVVLNTCPRNKPLAVIGGGDSAAEEATCKSLLPTSINSPSQLQILRFDKIWFPRIRSRPSWRTPCFENHGQTAHESPQSNHPLEHSRCRVSR